MAWGWSKVRYSPIAVDFGADSLKLLQIIPSDPPQLVTSATLDLPEAARADHASRYAFYADSLKDLINSYPFKGKRVMCSIPAYQTLVQHLQIPRTDDQEGVEAQVHQHLIERLNVNPSRMVVRCFSVGQVMREGGAKQEVICLAASRDATMQYLDIARRAKLEVVGMHSEPLAILKAFSHLYRRESDTQRVTCFIDLGCATTKVTIAHGTEMAFAKTIAVAGDHFTHQYAQSHGLGFSEARQKRLEQASAKGDSPQHQPAGTAELSESERRAQPPANAGMLNLDAPPAEQDASLQTAPAAVATATQTLAQQGSDALECLVEELNLCVRYHQRTFPDRKIEKLIFLGGEARQVAICQQIARRLRIGAQLGDPIARLVRIGNNEQGVDMRQPQPGWAVPMGLCISEANL